VALVACQSELGDLEIEDLRCCQVVLFSAFQMDPRCALVIYYPTQEQNQFLWRGAGHAHVVKELLF
jgi:hypothetical protein